MAGDVIVSADTRLADRLPAGHTRVYSWPTAAGVEVPPFDPAAWTLGLFPKPIIRDVKSFTWAEFAALPRVRVFADFHSVHGWSRLDNLWEGVSTRELLKHVEVTPAARFVMVHGEYGLCANLPLDDFLGEDCLLALSHDGRPLPPEHGGPVRLIVPRMLGDKSLRWVRGIEFMEADRPGITG